MASGRTRSCRGSCPLGMARRQWDEDPAYRRRAQEAIALGELQDPNSVADAFAFLCSPMASYMTGCSPIGRWWLCAGQSVSKERGAPPAPRHLGAARQPAFPGPSRNRWKTSPRPLRPGHRGRRHPRRPSSPVGSRERLSSPHWSWRWESGSTHLLQDLDKSSTAKGWTRFCNSVGQVCSWRMNATAD